VHDVRSNGIPAVDECGDLSSISCATPATRPRWIGKSHLQNFTRLRADHQAAAAARRLHEPSPGLTQALRDHLAEPKYEQETPAYWKKPDAKVQTPFYGFDHVTLVRAHGDEPGG
jgi:hypothetical protein